MTSPMFLAFRGLVYVPDDVVRSQHDAVFPLTAASCTNICVWVKWSFLRLLLRSSIAVLLRKLTSAPMSGDSFGQNTPPYLVS